MRFWGWTFRIVIAILGVSLFILQSQFAKKSILEFILNQPLKNSVLKVEVGGVRGLFPFQFSVGSLELKNREAHLATLSDVTVFWSVPALLAQEIKVAVAKGNALSGEVTYSIGPHAIFINIKGDGLPLWMKSSLTSLVVDLPELTLARGKVVATLYDGQEIVTVTMRLQELGEDRLDIPDIIVSGKGVEGKWQGVVYPTQGMWEGEGALSIESLAAYNHWFSKEIAGFALLKCQKKLKGQTILDLNLQQVFYGDLGVQSLDINALIDDGYRGKVSVQGEGALLNHIPFSKLTANGSLEDGKGTFDFIGKGPQNISIHTQGIVDFATETNPEIEITLKQAELTHPLHQFSLKSPATIVWGDNVVRTQKVWLTAGGGTVTIQDLIVKDEILSGTVVIDRLPLTILRVINPDWVVSGYLTGKGKVTGTPERPDAELALEGKSLHWGLPEKPRYGSASRFGGMDISSTFTMSQGFLAWQVKLASGQLLALTSQGKLSVDQLYPTADSSIEGTIKGRVDMGIISLFIPNGDLIQGQASLDLSGKGTIQNSLINGHVSVTNGLYENAAFGTLIRNIKMQGNASNDVIIITSITGQDNSKGRVSGHCSVKLTSLLNPVVDLQLNLDKLIVVQNDEISGKASGALKLQGALFGEELQRAKITGDILIQPLEIHLEDHTQEIVTIKLLEKKKNGTYQTPKEYQKESHLQNVSSILPLDIKLRSAGDIYIRGYGFDAQWKGEMRAMGTLLDPHLAGEITLVRGKFDLVGKLLKLTEGRITFSQQPKNDPLLAIIGTREVGEITATMRIEGRASDPKITFSSNPSLPQEEVLARLLFGRGIDSMSVTQSLLLANALSTFKGTNNLNFTDKIRSAFGLDVLEFKERKSADGDEFKSATQQVSVGKQITDNVYLSLDQSVSGDGGTSATVQYDMTSNLKIEADVGGDKNTSVGFAWVKKY